ncbi:MAG: RDD family protein [Clostridiaceae bacterium]|nr:RDD family protein [Clostridiaceae bacterium]
MKKMKITTPENIEVEYVLAEIASRVAAAVIDTVIQGVLILPLAIGILLIFSFADDFWVNYNGWIIGGSLIILILIVYGYYIVMELSMNGQTIGKKALKLRTIRKNGQSLTLKHSAIRNLFRLFIDMYGIGVVLIFFSKERKRVGDYLASTIVVVEINKTRPITLENLQKVNENFSYYMSKEESGLLRDYYERKNNMEDYSYLRQELKIHFTNKFEALGILKEWQSFINEL